MHQLENSLSIFLGFNIMDFPHGSAGKGSFCNLGDLGSIPGLGRSPGERTGYSLEYAGLENSMDCIVHGLYSPWGRKQLDMTEQLSLSTLWDSVMALTTTTKKKPVGN